MSRPDVMHDINTAYVHDVSRDTVRSLSSLQVMPDSVRRENLLALARAVHAANGAKDLTPHVKVAVKYYARTSDPMPAWGRLLLAVRDCDADEVDAALDRLTGVAE